MTELTKEILDEGARLDKEAHSAPWEMEPGPDDSFIGVDTGERLDDYDGGFPVVNPRLFTYGRKWPSRETRPADGDLLVWLRNNAKELIAGCRKNANLREIVGKSFDEGEKSSADAIRLDPTRYLIFLFFCQLVFHRLFHAFKAPAGLLSSWFGVLVIK